MSAKDDYTIALNILARVGIDGEFAEEFAKAKSALHKYSSYTEMNPPQPPQAPISTPMDNSAIPNETMPQMP